MMKRIAKLLIAFILVYLAVKTGFAEILFRAFVYALVAFRIVG